MKHVYETATSRLKSTTDALGQTTTYTYGLDDQPAGIAYTGAAVTTPNVTFAYETNYPRLSSMTMAGVGTISQAFVPIDPANSVYGDGQLATVTGLWGDVTTYTYDQLGRVTGRQINGANNPATAAYDALGRVIGWSNSLGSFTPSYLVAGNGALTGRADFVTLPNGGKTDLGWAAALGDYRLQQIKNVGAGAATLSQFDTVQNPVGQITQWKQWHSGLGAGVAARRHEIGYDAADQIIGDEVRDDVSNALVKAFSYRFDLAGNRTGEQVDASVTTGAFNAKNQLTNLSAGGTATVIGNVSEAATVKVNGDVVALDAQRVWRKELTVAPGLNSFPVEATETSFTPGTVAQKTTKTLTLNVPVNPARTFAYNLNGSMTSDGGTRSFEWDGANRLTKILYTGTNLTTELSYDGQSRCIKLVEKNGVAVTSEKRFVWTGLTMAEERNASNVVQKQFHGDGVRLGPTSYYYTRDHLGSIREVTDNTGTVRTRYDYDPWGRRTKLLGGASDPEADFGFTGHYYHVASALHLAPFRQYDAGLARWISRDPIGERGGLNLHEYVANNPVNLVDSLGLLADGYFNIEQGLLTVVDRDTGASATVSAHAGSGPFQNDPTKTHIREHRDANGNLVGGPTPQGSYNILDDQKRRGWYELDMQDQTPGNDRNDRGPVREAIRLHPGMLSTGCATVPNQQDYRRIVDIISNTRTVPFRDANGNARTNYGTFNVFTSSSPRAVRR